MKATRVAAARSTVLAMGTVCGCGPSAGGARPALNIEAPHSPSAAPAVRASVPRSSVETPLGLCERVLEHNLTLLREAASHAYALMEASAPGRLNSIADAAARVAADAGKREVVRTSGVRSRIDSLDERELNRLEFSGNWNVRLYLQEKEEVAIAKKTVAALRAGEPIVATNAGAFNVELCRPDSRGAWAFWTVTAAYVPDAAFERWGLAEHVALARISGDGSVVLAQNLPSYLEAPSTHEGFPAPKDTNCCSNLYGVGEPQLLFENDQNGDGVPEIGIQAQYYVEGSSDSATILYRYEAGLIHEQENRSIDSMKDVDGDGRLDILARTQVTAAAQCGSGFDADRYSPLYLGHALPDGTYSFTDDTARSHLRQQCPAVPASFGTPEDLWCAKAWGIDEKTILRRAHAHCVKDPCAGPTKLEACETLESAARGFSPPIVLK